MWAPLNHPEHLRFYRSFRVIADQMAGMISAVEYLQTRSQAPLLYAFTSLARFFVTTAPSYRECEGHHYILIISPEPGRLALTFGSLDEGWGDNGQQEVVCGVPGFASEIEPMIQKLWASRPE